MSAKSAIRGQPLSPNYIQILWRNAGWRLYASRGVSDEGISLEHVDPVSIEYANVRLGLSSAKTGYPKAMLTRLHLFYLQQA